MSVIPAMIVTGRNPPSIYTKASDHSGPPIMGVVYYTQCKINLPLFLRLNLRKLKIYHGHVQTRPKKHDIVHNNYPYRARAAAEL